MWRFALLCSVVTLTVACTDGPGAPSANTDEVSLLVEGDPPPPPLDGTGIARFSPTGSDDLLRATESITQDGCVPPTFFFVIEGDYFQNKSERMARVNFTPVPGSGSGTIHETVNDLGDADAYGTLVVLGSDEQQHEIHLLDYTGTSLFAYERGDFFGAIGGALVAKVTACGETVDYNGSVEFNWVCSECGKKDF